MPDVIIWTQELAMPVGKGIELNVRGDGVSDGYWHLEITHQDKLVGTLKLLKLSIPYYTPSAIGIKLAEIIQNTQKNTCKVVVIDDRTDDHLGEEDPKAFAHILKVTLRVTGL